MAALKAVMRDRSSSRRNFRGESQPLTKWKAQATAPGTNPCGQKGEEIQTLHEAIRSESCTHYQRVAVCRLWTDQLDATEGVSPVPQAASRPLKPDAAQGGGIRIHGESIPNMCGCSQTQIGQSAWYHDISEQEGGEDTENQSGVENRPPGRRRLRGHAAQRRTMRQWTRTMPRPPPPPVYDAPPTQDIDRSPAIPPEMMQQAMQRLFVAYNQCVNRVAQTDDRMEQFRTNLRRDALELALNAQRTEQDVQHQHQTIAHIKATLFDDVQERVKSLEERLRHVMDHEMHINQNYR